MTKPLALPGQPVQAQPWPLKVQQTVEADLARLQGLWLRLDVALTTEPVPGSAAAAELTDWLAAFAHDLAAVSLRAALDHLVTWQRVYAAGFRPTYAHLSLIRTAHEGAWLAYWLMEPGVDSAARLARGVAAQCDDYHERRKVEEAIGLSSVTPPAKLAVDRLADLMVEATSRGLTRPNKKGDPILSTPLLSAVELFDKYEPVGKSRGSYLYRLLSGYAHGKQWAVSQHLQAVGPLDQAYRALVVVETNPIAAMAATQRAINAFEEALDAFIALRS